MPTAGYPPHFSYPPSACPPPSYYHPYPPPQPDRTHYHGSAYNGHRRCTFFQIVIICVVTIFVLSSLLSVVFWIVFQPRLPDFSVADIAVSGFNFPGNELSANWDVNVTVSNGNNKLGINYDLVKAAIDYEGEVLAIAALPPFYQEKQSSTTIPAHLVTASMFLSDFKSSQLKSDRNAGTVYVHILLLLNVQYKSTGWSTRWSTLRASCRNVLIEWASSGSNPAIGRSTSPGHCLVYRAYR